MSGWRLSVKPAHYGEAYEYHFDEEPSIGSFGGTELFVGKSGGRSLRVAVGVANTFTYYLEELGKEAQDAEEGKG